MFSFLEQKGQQLFGQQFVLHTSDRGILHKLAAYFLRDEYSCDKLGISLDKSIMLTGPIGCGKTTLVIHRYSRPRPQQSHQVTQYYCFDDLGIENNIKYYGNECNVMAEVLLSRYNLYVSRRLMTHITTNLSASELEEAYGNRLRSRLREMVNLIGFDNSVEDKRK